jgi:hypothetical protein
VTLLISASWAARIIGMSHRCPALCYALYPEGTMTSLPATSQCCTSHGTLISEKPSLASESSHS